MKYLSEQHIREIGTDWHGLADVVQQASALLREGETSQPVKPYLRYRNLKNRIIAMPAFVGGNINTAGIKWIASFPGNIEKQIPRAHATIILNEADTGIPFAILNTGAVSAIRTAAVTGAVIRKYLSLNTCDNLSFGIIGFGPIGRMHLSMIDALWGDQLKHIYIFDLRQPDLQSIPAHLQSKVIICDDWQTAFENSKIFITCTVSSGRYINSIPSKGTLHLNVSLRDYEPSFLQHVDRMVVDDWEEICRENTDVEQMHLQHGLTEDQTFNISQCLLDNAVLDDAADSVVMFNPMGMAIFDIAVARYYFDRSEQLNIGQSLN
ncbi:2,3-diaminopropionate biosynthesis protein SbnB [Chitinophaga rhizophila]|uniref:2,3-diaminopropionate biosynthesis protein SbnB n=1 Tax=Chitinophaga rhizophila TaxID=2866212 RepID=A0ABS7GL61_9BACT|nr:2,3-diaminopropionate biosynthesis protein SbnB [Chitinophaga rhizophila]MBW8687193.1 2,3-diaminopropionate biosynthesis protein SbnB [Chitinophaga rhizophila]